MPYKAIRDKLAGKPRIIHLDDDPEDDYDKPQQQQEEQGHEPLPPLQPSQQQEEGSSTIAPLSEGPKQEFFIFPMGVQPRSIVSTPGPDADFDLRRPELSAEEQRREKLGQYNYKEVEWPATSSPNTFNSADSNTAIRLQRDRERARDFYNRNYMRSRRRGGRYYE
jgi:hypothetical protein